MELTTIENSNETILLTLSKNPKRLILDVTRKHDGRRHVATYAVGSEAVYGGYNLIYFGLIEAIGPKTVTILERGSYRRHRLTFAKFAFWNRNPAEENHKRNSEWSD